MAFPLAAIPVALSVIQSLVKFRDRVDVILALHKASEPLPLLLPPPPPDYAPFANAMRKFFQTGKGVGLLTLHNRVQDFEKVLADPGDTNEELFHTRRILYDLYFAAANIQPTLDAPDGLDLGPETDPRLIRPEGEVQMAAFMVESHRLSRNPAVTRILLATADTVLEIAGANAGLFISNPKTRTVVESVLRDFAGEQDFDDQGFDRIFKRLLSATVVAALDTPGVIPDRPALQPFLRALADVRRDRGEDFLAEVLTMEGFEQLLGRFLTHSAQDPAFLGRDELTRKVFSAMLLEAANNVPKLRSDPKAFMGILEAGVKIGADHVDSVLARELDGKPLVAALVTGVSKAIANSAAPFQDLVQGEFWVAIYQATLTGIVENPALFGDDVLVQNLATKLVTGLAKAVETHDLRAVLSKEMLASVLTDITKTLAVRPELLGASNPAAIAIVGAALRSAATMAGTGKVTRGELVQLAQATLEAASALRFDPKFTDALGKTLVTAEAVLSDPSVAALLGANSRRGLLKAAVDVFARSAPLWSGMANRSQLQPVLKAVIATIAAASKDDFADRTLDLAIKAVLLEVGRRGNVFLEDKAKAADFAAVLALTLEAASDHLGAGVDQESVPRLLTVATAKFLRSPFTPTAAAAPEFQSILVSALATIDLP